MPNVEGPDNSLVRVVVDAMGGDHGPEETVKGAVQALQWDNIEILLVGDSDQVQAQLDRYDLGDRSISVVPSLGVISDGEHPLQAIRHKPEASILVATKLLKRGDADVLVSMGSTGASMASAVLVLGLMAGLDRPCLGGPFLGLAPRTVLVDMGSNVDCRPAMLLNFAAMGVAFARKFLNIKDPTVGLLSVGAETAKGNRQVQESHQLFQESRLNFVGNVEGMDFFTQRADVIVCDGFVGNILMKFTEGLGSALFPFLEQRLSSHMAPEEIKAIASDLWQVTNLPRTMGGPLFGVNGAVVLGHGSCKADGVAGAINTGVSYVRLGLLDSMREELLAVSEQRSAAGLNADS
jgi:glycerol-3-phosphate acyltransferase PlsX